MLQFLSRRRIILFSAILIALVLVILAAWTAVAGPTTVLRIIRYGDTNIDDYSHYPGRELTPSDAPFSLAQAEAGTALSDEVLADLLARQGFNQDFDTLLAANDTIAFLLIKDDTILIQRYYQGHTPSSLSQFFSVTKSFTSALIGLAIEDGLIEGVEQPVTDFVPELADAGFDEVNIHHLLTMTSGSDYQENDNPFGEHVILNYTPRLEERILNVEMETQPGTSFRYKSGDNALLGLLLSRAVAPETITEYTQRRLWSPLGMQDRGVWTVDHAGENGLEKTWCCLAGSARDLAKFGRLYLKRGAWHERQILPDPWVEQSTQKEQISEGVWPLEYQTAGWRNYGYQWWLASLEDDDYFALGKDGQFLYVNPATDVIVVRLGRSSGELLSSQWVSLFQSLAQATR